MSTNNDSKFLTDLNLKVVNDRHFILLSELIFYHHPSDLLIKVPVGFSTDLASVPRLLWSIFPPLGKYSKAAVIHDYLLLNLLKFNITKQNVHDIFYDAMIISDVPKWKANIFKKFVELYGLIS